MINIEENYVGGGSIASSTSASNYVDVPMSLFTTSSYSPASFNTQLLLRIKPVYTGARLRVQLLDSGGTATYFGYNIRYSYSSTVGSTSSLYSSNVDVGALPVYNKTGFEGVNTLIRVNTPNSWVASKAPMIRVDPHFIYSNNVCQSQCCITPYYNSTPTTVTTLRFYFDNTSAAYVSDYNLYAGV